MLSGVALPPYATWRAGPGPSKPGALITPLGVRAAAGMRPSGVVVPSSRSSLAFGSMYSCSNGPSARLAAVNTESATLSSTDPARRGHMPAV
jgi:hypothetical protein